MAPRFVENPRGDVLIGLLVRSWSDFGDWVVAHERLHLLFDASYESHARDQRQEIGIAEWIVLVVRAEVDQRAGEGTAIIQVHIAVMVVRMRLEQEPRESVFDGRAVDRISRIVTVSIRWNGEYLQVRERGGWRGNA